MLVPIALAITLAVFLLTSLIPGGAVAALLNGRPTSDENVANLRAKYGLDQPLVTQYWDWLTGVVQGDLGRSFRTSQAGERLDQGPVPPHRHAQLVRPHPCRARRRSARYLGGDAPRPDERPCRGRADRVREQRAELRRRPTVPLDLRPEARAVPPVRRRRRLDRHSAAPPRAPGDRDGDRPDGAGDEDHAGLDARPDRPGPHRLRPGSRPVGTSGDPRLRVAQRAHPGADGGGSAVRRAADGDGVRRDRLRAPRTRQSADQRRAHERPPRHSGDRADDRDLDRRRQPAHRFGLRPGRSARRLRAPEKADDDRDHCPNARQPDHPRPPTPAPSPVERAARHVLLRRHRARLVGRPGACRLGHGAERA